MYNLLTHFWYCRWRIDCSAGGIFQGPRAHRLTELWSCSQHARVWKIRKILWGNKQDSEYLVTSMSVYLVWDIFLWWVAVPFHGDTSSFMLSGISCFSTSLFSRNNGWFKNQTLNYCRDGNEVALILSTSLLTYEFGFHLVKMTYLSVQVEKS